MYCRQLVRLHAPQYGQSIGSILCEGRRHTLSAVPLAILLAENSLDLSSAARQRTVIRLDGGGGSDNVLRWLMGRGYHVLVKGFHGRRAAALAARVRRWDPFGDTALGYVSPPISLPRPTTWIVRRRWHRGRWHYSYYVTTLSFPSKRAFLQAYNQRSAMEVYAFREDKQGLGIAKRRKKRFYAQWGLVVLTDIAHNLLRDFVVHGLVGSPLANYGFKRLVRDVFHIPGYIECIGDGAYRVAFLSQTKIAATVQECLRQYQGSLEERLESPGFCTNC